MTASITEGIAEGSTEGITEGAAESLTGGITEVVREGMTAGFTVNSTEGITEGISEGGNEGIIAEITVFVSKPAENDIKYRRCTMHCRELDCGIVWDSCWYSCCARQLNVKCGMSLNPGTKLLDSW